MLEVEFTGWGKCWYVRIPGVHVQKQNIIRCGDEEITGLFRLEPKDEAEYLKTRSFAHVKKLRPCLVPGSTFYSLVENGQIPKIDVEHSYFEVKQYRDVYAPIPRQNVPVEVPNVFTVIKSDKEQTPAQSAELGQTEREYLMRTIGALSLLLVEKTPSGRFGTREKPNKLAIHREINNILSGLDLSTGGQSKSRLNDVLGEALNITLEQ